MRKRSNVLRSGKSKSSSLSMTDLITHSEQTISSQASVYTNGSKRSQLVFSQLSTNSQDFQDYEDIMGEDIDTLFITPQEEKKIQNILEFARKGKINPANAFEIPVRVIDPQIAENSNMRFWKFASELLYASMSIYDKRVQNMYQNTNRMFDNLVRVQGQPNQPLTDEQLEEKQRKQRGELIRMEVGEVGKTEGVSSYEIGSVNCEDTERINIKSLRHQFLPDPLFGRRLQAFDSNSLKSLFMNAFECGIDTQIVFFNSSPKEEVKEEELKNQVKEEEQMSDYEERIPRFLSKQIQSNGSLQRLSQLSSFQTISEFKRMNVRQSLQNTRNQVRDFTNDLQGFNKEMKEMERGDIFPHLNHTQISETQSMTQAGDGSFDFHFNAPEHTQLSEQIRFQSETKQLSHAFSSQHTSQSPFFAQDIYQNNSQMTPWELQFKGLKLQRRKNMRRNVAQGQAKQKKTRMESTYQLDFLNGPTDTRSKVFRIIKSRTEQASQDIQERFLLPKQMNPFTVAYKQRKMQQRMDFAAFLNAQNQVKSKLPSGHKLQDLRQQQMEFQPEQASHHADFNLQSITQRSNGFQSNVYEDQHQTQGVTYRSSGIRNIRQVKQKIYRHIEHGRRIRLSALNINLHPSSLLIIFLHLVNQNNLVIESVDHETDIEICLRSP